ncbi:hypothetical protein DPMN_018110 [Dreissena polymorpha]|uniref:Uncharacterized protein n=1 Tax=Dreissena polymorpha TaxID=45954 RepID=A0A9D4S703_DREPO|nr:hypothetical protein DPMN_018110 [Dreissena polymorpha]
MYNHGQVIDTIRVYSLLECWCTQQWSGKATAWDCTEDGRAGGLTCGLTGVGAKSRLQRFHNVFH